MLACVLWIIWFPERASACLTALLTAPRCAAPRFDVNGAREFWIHWVRCVEQSIGMCFKLSDIHRVYNIFGITVIYMISKLAIKTFELSIISNVTLDSCPSDHRQIIDISPIDVLKALSYSPISRRARTAHWGDYPAVAIWGITPLSRLMCPFKIDSRKGNSSVAPRCLVVEPMLYCESQPDCLKIIYDWNQLR